MWGDMYVSNGAMIAAAIIRGWRVCPEGELNAWLYPAASKPN
jgi:hypothetical protein